jgi:DNA-binding NarL/FixJ family response regulator
VGEAADTEELLAQIGHLRPDVILLDQNLSGWSTTNVAAAFCGLDYRPHVILMGTHSETMQTECMEGADAFVSKGEPPKRLLTAIRALLVES